MTENNLFILIYNYSGAAMRKIILFIFVLMFSTGSVYSQKPLEFTGEKSFDLNIESGKGNVYTKSLIIRNNSDIDVNITAVKASSLLNAKMSDPLLSAGDTAAITITTTAEKLTHYPGTSIILETDHPGAKRLIIPVNISEDKPLTYKPNQMVLIASPEGETSKILTFKNTTEKDITMQLSDIEPVNIYLDESGKIVIPANSSVDVPVFCVPGNPKDIFFKLVFSTDHPEQHEIMIRGGIRYLKK